MSVLRNTYRFSTEEYARLGEAGIFSEDDRVELLDGELILMSPIGSRHAAIVKTLNRALSQLCGERFLIGVQDPVILDDASEPEPDLSLLEPREDAYASALPRAEHVQLIIEVSDASLDYDRGPKLAAYARNNIPEVWVVNLIANTIEMHRAPAGQTYKERTVFQRGDTLNPACAPEVSLAVSSILVG